jgi:UDP-N-acetylmuramyl pentapeptide phosphotransferase/UDP-N-acetylglucosamine-1-phosphate transferase
MTEINKHVNRIMAGMAIVSVFTISVCIIWFVVGLYMDEPTFISTILLLMVVCYFIGWYFNRNKENA